MESQPLFSELIFKEISGFDLDTAERSAVNTWVNEKPSRARMLADLRNPQWRLPEWERYQNIDKQASWKALQARIAADSTVPPLPDLTHPDWVETQRAIRATVLMRVRRAAIVTGWAVAASTVTAVGIGGWYHYTYPNTVVKGVETATSHPPASYEATLTVGGTSGILLADRAMGLIAEEDGLGISKSLGGVLVFSREEKNGAKVVGKPLSVATRTGSTYKLAMPEGSRVQLSPASMIQFSTDFGLKGREIALSGEGLFDVATIPLANGKEPFIVHVLPPAMIRQQFPDSVIFSVVATGTRFNIEAYGTDSGGIRATLLAGSIEVRLGGRTIVLQQPGETFVLDIEGEHRVQSFMDAKLADSLKSEFFFENEPVDHILEKLGRWYNVKFYFKDRITDSFRLQASKDQSIESLLTNYFEKSGHIHFIIGKDSIAVTR